MANFQLGDVEKAPFNLVELDADSNPAKPAPGDVISITSSDTASATIVMDATAAGSQASGFVVGGKKLQVGVLITATVKHTDGTTLSVTDTIDIVGGAASSLSLGLGAPVPQP